jgi:type 1 fimbriae regulatory protein FimB/type 1 fimbriae regulatory protein FimE
LRPREYLTPAEVENLTKAARKGRHGHRDTTLILVAYRHGLRAVEICDLEWSQVEFDRAATLHVRRAKNGKPATHPIRGDELRALRELQRQTSGGYVFETERSTPFTTDAVNRLVKRIGERAGFPTLSKRRPWSCGGLIGARYCAAAVRTGSLAIFAAILRASSFVSNLDAEHRSVFPRSATICYLSSRSAFIL